MLVFWRSSFVACLIVQELDLTLAKKDWYIKELESNLHEQKEVNSRQHDELKLLNERLNNDAKRIKSLERDCDRLRSEISLLESKVSNKIIVRIAVHKYWKTVLHSVPIQVVSSCDWSISVKKKKTLVIEDNFSNWSNVFTCKNMITGFYKYIFW